MPTFLTTSRMPRALAARIEASVRGGRPTDAAFGPRVIALFRLALLLGIVAATASLFVVRHRLRSDLEQARGAVIEAVAAQRASFAKEDLGAVARAEAWLLRLSGPYEGDVVEREVTGDGALATVLARPSVYVRGPIAAFRAQDGVARASATSFKDAFLLCLVDPPPDRSEKAQLAKVHLAYGGGAKMEQRTATAHRLDALEVGMPVLAPAWAERVAQARERADLDRFQRELAHAPLDEARRAAAARLLVAVMDEPGDAGGLSELDGERPHDVRVAVVDLSAGKVLLRLRRRVDPSWISLSKRADYASGLDACALALDLRERAGSP